MLSPGFRPLLLHRLAGCVLFVLTCIPTAASAQAPVQADTSAADTSRIDTTLTAQARDDALTATRLRTVLAELDGFDAVEVQVTQGIVRLSGTVVEPKDQEQAEAIAAALPGVLHVINDLSTDVEIDARVSPALERVQAYVNNAVAYLPVVGVALVVLLLFALLAALIGRLPMTWLRLSPLVTGVVVRLLRFAIVVIGLVLVLDILGITALVGAVLGTAGLVGIAIGFAFQDIIENYLAGLLLSIRQPFALNDHVVVSGEEGKVIRLTSRELILMTLDGNHVRIPNASVFKSTIYNYTRNPLRRFSFEVGVDVDEDLQAVQRIGIDTLHVMPGVTDEPRPFMRVKALGDFNMVVTFFGWVDQRDADFGKVYSEAIRLVKTALDGAGVLMPEPIYNVRMQTVTTPPGSTTLDRKAEKAAQPKPLVSEQAVTADVAPDDDLDVQIRQDLASSDEPNLLVD